MPTQTPTRLDRADTVFLCIDIQPRERIAWTAAKVLEVFKREAFTVEELNGGLNHFFDVALPNAVRVSSAARAAGLPRIFVHWAAGSNGLREDHASPHGDFRVEPGDVVLPKTEMDAFPSSNLPAVLKKLGRKTLLMVGGHTRGCLGETAQSALKSGFQAICVRDATFDCSIRRWPLGIEEIAYHEVISTKAALERLA